MAKKRRNARKRPAIVAPPDRTGGVDHPIAFLTTVTIACLLPFIGKAFTIDDPLFLWAAQHITVSPTDPYGFDVNWYGYVQRMSDVMENPPFTSYFIAFASKFFGWNEVGLHLAFLLPAVVVIAATYSLARHLCGTPHLAAVFTLLMPGFLISATNVMSDIPMLACFTCAIVLWIRGLQDRPALLWLGALTAAVAGLFKYFGAAAVPLLAAFAVAKHARMRHWLPPLVTAVAALLIYDHVTRVAYGHGLMTGAIHYAATQKTHAGANALSQTILALNFVGGSVVGLAFFLPLLNPKLWIASLASALAAIVAIFGGNVRTTFGVTDGYSTLALLIFTACGIFVVFVCFADVLTRRTPESLLLILWIGGTITFAAYLNWTVSVRSVLPVTPAVAILTARWIVRPSRARIAIPLVATAVLSLLVGFADERFADAQRNAAKIVLERYAADPHRLWFEGHWGFQYYMERGGGTPVDLNGTLHRNDLLTAPSTNTRLLVHRPPHRIIQEITIPTGVPASTMSRECHAGFYSDFLGALPYSIGVTPRPQRFIVMRLGR